MLAWLAEQPEAAARVAVWRSQNEAIRRLYPAASAFRPQKAVPAPDKIEPIRSLDFRLEDERRRSRTSRMTGALALTVALTLGAMVIFARDGTNEPRPPAAGVIDPAPADAAARAVATWRAYADDPSHAIEIPASDPRLGAWLAARTGVARAPDIAGAQLIGARVSPGAQAPAAFLLYATGDGGRIALTGEKTQAAQPAQAAQGRTPGATGDLNVRVWRAGGFDWTLTGRVSRERLDALAGSLAR